MRQCERGEKLRGLERGLWCLCIDCRQSVYGRCGQWLCRCKIANRELQRGCCKAHCDLQHSARGTSATIAMWRARAPVRFLDRRLDIMKAEGVEFSFNDEIRLASLPR